MVSGIECAGIVLGVLPLLMSLAKHCAESFRTFKDSQKYVSVLTQYSNDLVLEQTQFKSTWGHIINLIDPNSAVIQQRYRGVNFNELSDNPHDYILPTGVPVDLVELLSFALAGYDKSAVIGIQNALDEISDLVKEMAAEFLKFVDEPLQNDFMATGKINLGKKSLKKVLRMLKAEIDGGNKIRNDQLSRIRQLNKRLCDILFGEYLKRICALISVRSQTPETNTIAKTQTKMFNIVQKGMEALHTAVKGGFQTSGNPCCKVSHNLGLRLDILDVICDPCTSNVRDDHRFWVTFAFENHSQTRSCDFDVTMLSTTISPPQPIVDNDSTILPSDKQSLTAYSHDVGSKDDTSMRPPSQDQTSDDAMVHGQKRSVIPKFRFENPFSQKSAPSRVARDNNKGGILTLTTGRSPKRTSKVDLGSLDESAPTGPHDSQSPPSSLVCRPYSPHSVKSSTHSQALNHGLTTMTQSARGPSVSNSSPQNGTVTHSMARDVPQITLSDPEGLSVHPTPHSRDSQGQPASKCRSCACTITNDKSFASLCPVIHIPPSLEGTESETKCVGILSTTSGIKFHICPRQNCHLNSKFENFVTLRQILEKHSPSHLLKLKLAALLASSVMQLHGTGWLKASWSSADIYFEGLPTSPNTPLGKPLIRGLLNKHMHGGNQTEAHNENLIPPTRFVNQTLYSLGIVLVELIYWKPFQDLRGERTIEDAVCDLVDNLDHHVPGDYQLAVQGCIIGFREFLLRQQKLENEDFKVLVYVNIVSVIVAELKRYMPRGEDFLRVFKDGV